MITISMTKVIPRLRWRIWSYNDNDGVENEQNAYDRYADDMYCYKNENMEMLNDFLKFQLYYREWLP